MNIRSIFMEPLKPMHPVYRYGMLVLILYLLAENIRWYFTLTPDWPYDRYGGLIGVLMLLFTHLSFVFRWPTSITVILRVLTFGLILFGGFYVFYLSRVLYPLH